MHIDSVDQTYAKQYCAQAKVVEKSPAQQKKAQREHQIRNEPVNTVEDTRAYQAEDRKQQIERGIGMENCQREIVNEPKAAIKGKP